VLQASPGKRYEPERVMVGIATEERHKVGDRVGYTHPKDLFVESLLLAQITRKKDDMIEAQRFDGFCFVTMLNVADLRYQFDDIPFRVAEPEQPADARFHSPFRPEDNWDALPAEDFNRPVEFVIIRDLKGYVMKASVMSR